MIIKHRYKNMVIANTVISYSEIALEATALDYIKNPITAIAFVIYSTIALSIAKSIYQNTNPLLRLCIKAHSLR